MEKALDNHQAHIKVRIVTFPAVIACGEYMIAPADCGQCSNLLHDFQEAWKKGEHFCPEILTANTEKLKLPLKNT